MASNPLVSVIIPTRNEEKNIEECLINILRQSYKRKEVIVVDGGSTDRTKKIAKKYGVRILQEIPPRGPANARNIGAEAAHGEILFFLDADVVIKKDAIEKALEFLNKNNLDAVIPLTQIYPTKKLIPNLYFAERLSSRLDISPNFFKRNVFLKVKFDPSLGVGEDVDIRERLDRIGVKIGFTKKAIAYHKEPNLWKVILEAKWWGRTYLPLLRKGYKKVIGSVIWIFAVASIIPLIILSQYFKLASLILFPIVFTYVPYSIYKILKSIKNGANPSFALMIPFFKIFKYSIFSFYILKGLFFRKNFRGR